MSVCDLTLSKEIAYSVSEVKIERYGEGTESGRMSMRISCGSMNESGYRLRPKCILHVEFVDGIISARFSSHNTRRIFEYLHLVNSNSFVISQVNTSPWTTMTPIICKAAMTKYVSDQHS
jgi:hypothetical protein